MHWRFKCTSNFSCSINSKFWYWWCSTWNCIFRTKHAVAGSGANGTCFTGGSGGEVRGNGSPIGSAGEMQKIEVEEVVLVDVITMHVMEVLETLLELMQVVNILVQVVVIMELVV